MAETVFEAKMTSKGQVMIFKGIREKLGLAKEQCFIEKAEDNRVVLEPVPSLASLGGSLKNIAKKKGITQLMREARDGWD